MKEIKTPRKPLFMYYIIAMVVLMLLNTFLFPSLMKPTVTEVPYSQFLAMLEEGKVDAVEMEQNRLLFRDKQATPAFYETGLMDDPGLVQRLQDAKVAFGSPIIQQASPLMSFLLTWLLPIGIFVVLGQYLSKGMMQRMGGTNAMQLGKANAKIYIESKTGIKFGDVAGQDEAKEALTEIVDFLHNPEKYTAIGAVMPKGALLVGPPGTGKTLLAKAVAGEANVPFFSISGSEFVEMFVGMGAAKVRDLFKQAAEKAPCIVFIDEIDTIGKRRDQGGLPGSNDEREQTLNQLLSEMDGFDGRKGVVILAATNRPEVLDPALLRPGRFDRRIPVELPDLQGRIAILEVHIKKVKTEPGIRLDSVARTAAGASGADLANIINEAALRAVREGRHAVTQEDLEESVETVIAGAQQKSRVLSDREKKIVAYHEVGHALVSALQSNSQPVQKITIVPRTMGSLGYTMNMPEEERYLLTKSELLAQITTLLGGRAAETVKFGEVTTGASNDIQRATKLARSMVTQYGMSEAFGPMGLETTENQYLDGRNVFGGSDQSSARVDQEVRGILDKCQKDAIKLIEDNAQALERISAYLLDKENITGEEFMDLLKAA